MKNQKRFVIVTKGADGAIELHPMWEWIRKHPEHQPKGMTSDRNSHWLRDALRKDGWEVNETEGQVRLLPPEVAADPASAAVLGAPAEDSDDDAEERFEFALESHLRDFIVRNLGEIRINGSRLHLFSDSSGREGVEYPTGVGLIDVLAEGDSGDLFVFELKVSRGPDKAMGQLTRYMGWVSKHLGNQRKVSGILVAKDIDEKLRYGALVVPNVSLLEYEVSFRLRDASAT